MAGRDHAKLSANALHAIELGLSGGNILLSAISAWELTMLVSRGRLGLSMDVTEWLAVVDQIDAVRFVPVDTDIAVKSATLPEPFHKDPADRIIVTTARRFNAALITADEKIRAYPHVHTIW